VNFTVKEVAVCALGPNKKNPTLWGREAGLRPLEDRVRSAMGTHFIVIPLCSWLSIKVSFTLIAFPLVTIKY